MSTADLLSQDEIDEIDFFNSILACHLFQNLANLLLHRCPQYLLVSIIKSFMLARRIRAGGYTIVLMP